MSDKELMILSASEQDECRQYIAWTTGGPEPDWENMATWLVKCADNRKQNAALKETISRLEREKGLLVDLYERHKHLDTFLSDETFPPIGRTGSAILYELWEFVKEAAIDGGALGSGE